MRYCNEQAFRSQFEFLKRQFLQDGGLPFTDVLSRETVEQALDTIEFAWNERIYTPLVTLWVFLGQVLSADHSCRNAVARLVVHRVSQGLSVCSSRTGAYCQARKRLPEQFFSTIARMVATKLEDQANKQWLWKGRHVYMFDGTTTLMPDTKENAETFPLAFNQQGGVGLPLARVGAIFSLSCGVILDLKIAKYAGKGQGEVTLLHRMLDLFTAGDVLLADALMCNFRVLFSFKERGVDVVTRLNKAHRKADFRCGKRLGKEDHLVKWRKPSRRRGLDRDLYNSMPEYITVREARVRIDHPGFRTKSMVIVTTLLDPVEYTKQDLANLYRERWNNELDLRTIKSVMQMECLRGKTPELVRKEIWTHVLAYNLIRTIMAQAATKSSMLPRTISFKGTLQTLEAFQPVIAIVGHDSAMKFKLYQQLLDAIVLHRVADRPNRFEPRRHKRRHKHYVPLSVPRAEAKLQILKGLTKN